MAHQRLKSGMGKAMETFLALVEEVEDLGGSDEDIRRILADDGLRRHLAEQLIADRVVSGCYQISVDYNQSLADMVQAGGYDYTEGEVCDRNYPLSGMGRRRVEAVLFHFNKPMTTDAVVAVLERRGFYPANLRLLLALGATQPELQRMFPIIALSASYVCERRGLGYVSLYRTGVGRSLGHDWCNGRWEPNCRFAAARKG